MLKSVIIVYKVQTHTQRGLVDVNQPPSLNNVRIINFK